MKNVRFSRNGVEFEPTKQELKIVLDDFAKQLGERDKRIADLERQLEESKKPNEYFVDRIEKADKEIKEIYKQYNELVEEDNQLKRQLAESEEENETFRKALQGEIFINYEIPMENERLKQELADKDKLINDYADNLAMLQCKIADLDVKEIKAEDFAIEQLEKVKQWCSKYEEDLIDYEDGLVTKVIGLDDAIYIAEVGLYDFIDQQIKELRGENV